jgi:hypothetical protein
MPILVLVNEMDNNVRLSHVLREPTFFKINIIKYLYTTNLINISLLYTIK